MSILFPLLTAVLPLAGDTAKSFEIEEAVVVASPKETGALRKQSLSVSLFDARALRLRGIHAAKDLSALAPNLHQPDYGSRLTSALYIRGIGSRINTPAVGMYVDNVPYIDKTGYDFTFCDVERVDVLRGPQGTLYGRGAMGGVLRVFTANPLHHSGTEVEAGFATRSAATHAAFTTYLHPAEAMGLSLSAFYDRSNGFFTNRTTGHKQDAASDAGAKLRWVWQPTDLVKIDWTASYQYTDQDANPYHLVEDLSATAATNPLPHGIYQNRPSTYRRHLLNTGLGVEHDFSHFVLTSTTAWQYIDDCLFMDQDFTARDIFTLEQQQRMSNLTEEIALRSRDPESRCKWTTGAFFMYQHLHTDCPVTFYADGMSYLNGMFAGALPAQPPMSLTLTAPTLPLNAALKTPALNAALFGQATVADFPLRRLDLTLGFRADYDHRSLNLHSGAAQAVDYHFAMGMGPQMSLDADLQADPALTGKLHRDTWQLLPKIAIAYRLPSGCGQVYLSATKGCRAGGYNIQAYSDLSQVMLRRSIMQGVQAFSTQQISALPLPPERKEAILGMMNGALTPHIPATPDVATLYYKPETAWSYEAGTHLTLLQRRLWVDAAAFYMTTRNQQLARFAGSQFGRTVVNAGRSASMGAELGLRASLLADRLRLTANYGYTYAEFRDYDYSDELNLRGSRVPFVPLHTMSASADFRQPLAAKAGRSRVVKALFAGIDVKGNGNVKWDELNRYSRPFHAVIGARLGAEVGNGSISLWARNLTDTRYSTFEFENMNHRFAQYNAPRHFGIDVRWKF